MKFRNSSSEIYEVKPIIQPNYPDSKYWFRGIVKLIGRNANTITCSIIENRSILKRGHKGFILNLSRYEFQFKKLENFKI